MDTANPTDVPRAMETEPAGTIERLFSRDMASELPAKEDTNADVAMPSPLDRLFSRDVASELPVKGDPNADAAMTSPLERMFSRDAAADLDAPPPEPLQRLFSRDAGEELTDAADVTLTSQRGLTPFERVLMGAAGGDASVQIAQTQTLPERDETMSPTSILETAGESEGDTPLAASVSELEALVFSPSGPREGAAQVPEGPRGMEHFRTALDAHVRPTPPPPNPQLLARRDRYEAALLELNAQFKARWLDFDQSVAMAEPHAWPADTALTPGRSPTDRVLTPGRSPTNPSLTPERSPVNRAGDQAGETRSGVNRLGGLPSPLVVAGHTFDPALNCPTPPGALTAPASPPLSAEELAGYLASLGIAISAEKAAILVGGYQDETDGEPTRVKMQRLRKDMRVAVARSLRPVPSPRGSFVGAHANGTGSPATPTETSGAVTAAIDAIPLPALAPVNVRITGATSLSKGKSPAGQKSASGSSDESPCIWSPKVGIPSRPLGATPPAIDEAPEEDSSQHGGQAMA